MARGRPRRDVPPARRPPRTGARLGHHHLVAALRPRASLPRRQRRRARPGGRGGSRAGAARRRGRTPRAATRPSTRRSRARGRPRGRARRVRRGAVAIGRDRQGGRRRPAHGCRPRDRLGDSPRRRSGAGALARCAVRARDSRPRIRDRGSRRRGALRSPRARRAVRRGPRHSGGRQIGTERPRRRVRPAPARVGGARGVRGRPATHGCGMRFVPLRVMPGATSRFRRTCRCDGGLGLLRRERSWRASAGRHHRHDGGEHVARRRRLRARARGLHRAHRDRASTSDRARSRTSRTSRPETSNAPTSWRSEWDPDVGSAPRDRHRPVRRQ